MLQGVQAALQRAPVQAGQQCMVWGSSLGWLVFFARLAHGWHAEGYELLGCLVNEARSTAAASCIGEAPCMHAPRELA